MTGPAPRPRPDELDFSRAILRAEAAAVAGLAESLGEEFCRAVDLLETCANSGGTVLVTGLGKSGLIGAKISATLASLGIPSHAVHPAEAAHGDLGRFRATDTVIALSFSGETDEVVNLVAILRQDGLPVIGVTGQKSRSSLERLATVTLGLNLDREAGAPIYAAPTSSTTAMAALGDALALAVARRRHFTDHDFARRHPGGALGGLLRPVSEALRVRFGVHMPALPDDLTVRQALERAAAAGRRPGALVLVEAASGRLSGILTDGDVRRLILRDARELERPIRDVMTRSPRSLPASALVRDAVRMFREHRQDEIPIVDEQGRPVGLLDVQDLMALRLVTD